MLALLLYESRLVRPQLDRLYREVLLSADLQAFDSTLLTRPTRSCSSILTPFPSFILCAKPDWLASSLVPETIHDVFLACLGHLKIPNFECSGADNR